MLLHPVIYLFHSGFAGKSFMNFDVFLTAHHSIDFFKLPTYT